MIITRKISETILEFGNHLIEELPKNSTKEQFEPGWVEERNPTDC